MRYSALALPLIVTPAVTVAALNLDSHNHGMRSNGNHQPALRAAQAEAGEIHRSSEKRVVKRKAKSHCQVPLDPGLTSPATTSASTEPSVTATVDFEENFATHNGGDQLTTTTTTTSTSATTPTSTSSSSSSWYKTDDWSGSTFFDNWSFWEWDDPTHGTVEFQRASDAWASGLISINGAGRAVMSVDTTEKVSGGRQAIRIYGNKVWTGGMVLMDAYHMPTGCGTWPAWWQNGPNWPNGGEIDILEGVNDFTQNQISLHTGRGCTMPQGLNNNQLAKLTTGNYDSYDCSSDNTANQGCGARDETFDNSYGEGFNQNNGGVYALIWAKAGIKAWFFPRSRIPADITNDAPNPSGWGVPVANFPSDNCSPYEFFHDHFNIFDTTFCGDWAGNVWNHAGYAGQQESCAASTGYSSCSEYVLNKGSAFKDAFWEVSYVKYFNSTTEV